MEKFIPGCENSKTPLFFSILTLIDLMQSPITFHVEYCFSFLTGLSAYSHVSLKCIFLPAMRVATKTRPISLIRLCMIQSLFASLTSFFVSPYFWELPTCNFQSYQTFGSFSTVLCAYASFQSSFGCLPSLISGIVSHGLGSGALFVLLQHPVLIKIVYWHVFPQLELSISSVGTMSCLSLYLLELSKTWQSIPSGHIY